MDAIGEFSWTLVDNFWVNSSGHFLGEFSRKLLDTILLGHDGTMG